jgi:hypothetical protein
MLGWGAVATVPVLVDATANDRRPTPKRHFGLTVRAGEVRVLDDEPSTTTRRAWIGERSVASLLTLIDAIGVVDVAVARTVGLDRTRAAFPCHRFALRHVSRTSVLIVRRVDVGAFEG